MIFPGRRWKLEIKKRKLVLDLSKETFEERLTFVSTYKLRLEVPIRGFFFLPGGRDLLDLTSFESFGVVTPLRTTSDHVCVVWGSRPPYKGVVTSL